MKIYFISGLGADERVFNFLDLPEIEKVFIKWLRPEPGESLTSYSQKLVKQINTNEEVILLGISFGGIVAQEIGKLIQCKKIIIVSSIKSSSEFGWQLAFARQTKIHSLLPAHLLKKGSRLTADYYFSIKSKEESIFLQQIIEDTDNEFLKWAIGVIMKWGSKDCCDNIIHIHGTDDRIFPINPIKDCIKIKDGGHFMIVNKCDEVSRVILEEVNK